MKRMSQLFLFVLCAVFFSLQIAAQSKSVATKNGDPRVAKALSQTKTEFKMDEDGDYEIIFGVKGDRTQKAHINTPTDNIYDFEMRGVYSFAAFSETPFSQEVTNLLLQQNMENVSAWAVIKVEDSFAIVNIMYIPADSDGKRLDSAIKSVILLADEMEERLTKEDKL